MMKKIFAIFLAASMALSFAACSNKEDESSGGTDLAGTYDIVVWTSENATELTKKQIEAFNNSNGEGIVIKATVEPVSESEAGTNMVTDVEAGADIFCFAQDQFARLVQAGALAKLGVSAAETVTSANDPSVVAAAQAGSDLYAYPMTSDNGYFMYYDKSVIPEKDIDDLAAIIADCEAAGKYFAMSLEGSAWYNASFFFATGCTSEWVTDDDGEFVSVNDNFNSENGFIAAKGMKLLLDSPMLLDGDDLHVTELVNGAAVVISGTWDYVDGVDALGDNLGVADLPSFTVDGKTYHLGSYSGCKLMGVKPQTDAVRSAVLHKLAQYLTDEERQLERFKELAWGPANLNAQKSDEVQANPGLAALFEQNNYAVPQAQIHGSWWDIAKVIATDLKAASTDDEIQAALDSYEAKLAALFTMSSDEKNAFTVIGHFYTIDGEEGGWNADYGMVETDGVWKTLIAYELTAGDEFKVRKGKNWDDAYPAENYVVEEDGTFFINFNASTQEITLTVD